MTKRERFLIHWANVECDKAKVPAKNRLDIDETEHGKKEGQYEAYLVAQAFRAASKGVK